MVRRRGSMTRRLAIVVASASTVIVPLATSTGVGAMPSYDTSNPWGDAVAVAGRRAVLGVPSYNGSQGIIYQYRLGTAWKKMAQLTVSGIGPGDSFGASIAYTGNNVVIGSPGRNTEEGAVYYVYHSDGIWGQIGGLTDPSPVIGGHFGAAVGLSGERVVVGAPGTTTSGKTYIGRAIGGVWTITNTLLPPSSASDDRFGTSVAVLGNHVLVGAPGTSSGAGAAYLFTFTGGTWNRTRTLTEASPVAGDGFGTSVAFTDTGFAIGVPGRSVTGHSGAGVVEAYDSFSATTPTTLTASSPVTNSGLGKSLATYKAVMIAGAPGTSTVDGLALLFSHHAGTWSLSNSLTDPTTPRLGWSVGISGQVIAGPHNSHQTRLLPIASPLQFDGTVGR